MRLLTIYNVLAFVFILWQFGRDLGVTYFLTTPVFSPFSLVVLGFDLYLAAGPILAVLTKKRHWWKVGLFNFVYALVVAVIVVVKLFVGSRAAAMSLSDFWLNLIIYAGQLVFFGVVTLYWLQLKKSFFNKK